MSQHYNLTDEQSHALLKWQEVNEQLETLKATEMALRLHLVDSIAPVDKAEGSSTVEIGNGWKLTAERKLNYSVDKEHVQGLVSKLPYDLAQSLIRWKPELNLPAYRNSLTAYRSALSTDSQKELAEAVVNAITIRPGTPSLKLVAPKDK